MNRWVMLFAVVSLAACGGVDDSSDDAGTTASTGGGSGGGGGSTSASGGGGGSIGCADSWSSWASSFFASNCTTCHQHSSDFGSRASVVAALSTIRSEISTGRMPEGSTLSASDKARVLAWLDCGAP